MNEVVPCSWCLGAGHEPNWIQRKGHLILNRQQPRRDCSACGGTGQELDYGDGRRIPATRALVPKVSGVTGD